MIRILFSIFFVFMAGAISPLQGQDHPADTSRTASDTTRTKNIMHEIKNSRVSRGLVKSIKRKNQNADPTATLRSEDAFMPYEGKIIRKILIRQVGFDKVVTDTTRRIRNTMARIGNRLHGDTREWVIRDNLFIRENKPVNPYRMADNERYLRDLDFILDARFFIIPLISSTDSVDIIVMTRDVFSIGGTISPIGPTKTRVRLYDVNLFGMGQRLQFNGLVDKQRNPVFGYEMVYRKNSVGGTFVTATGGYTQLNTGSSYGNEMEKAYYIRLERPLVSPYTRLAGGFELSRNWSNNVYEAIDTLFRRYRYQVHDFWAGYNIGANANMRDRSRHFIAFRAFDQLFKSRPSQNADSINPVYNNRTYYLAGLTFFKQNFYTARYIYGFGRTEDIPYGRNLSIYVGWARQLGYERPYIGFDFGKSFVSRRGYFYNMLLRTGAFANDGLEDATLLLSGSITSKLIMYRRLLIRQSFGGDLTQVFNQRTTLPLDINDEFGLKGFGADSLWGNKRIHLNSETLIFTPLEPLGFRMAPFAHLELASLASRDESLAERKPFFGVGGGIRTRNENLVFGTIELRVIYYPRTVEGLSNVNFRIVSNLRVKYSAGFVRPPTFVQYN